MGIIGSVSINSKVRFSSILMILPSFPFCSILTFSPLALLSLPHVFLFSFFDSVSSFPPVLGLSWTNRNSGHPHPSLFAPDHDLFDGCLGLALNNALTMPPSVILICQPELPSTPAQYLLLPPQFQRPCSRQRLFLPHFSLPFHPLLPLPFANLL